MDYIVNVVDVEYHICVVKKNKQTILNSSKALYKH